MSVGEKVGISNPTSSSAVFSQEGAEDSWAIFIKKLEEQPTIEEKLQFLQETAKQNNIYVFLTELRWDDELGISYDEVIALIVNDDAVDVHLTTGHILRFQRQVSKLVVRLIHPFDLIPVR